MLGWASGAGDPTTGFGTDGGGEPAMARQVLVPELPDDHGAYEAFLAGRRGGPVTLRVPHRGGKRQLMDTACKNAAEELVRHRLRRASDHDSRARALAALAEAVHEALGPGGRRRSRAAG